MECPANAISFKNDNYWIDPEKCVSCGSCAAVCHNGCISDPSAPKEPVQTHDTIRMDCDVVVIGGGAAGMVAAAKAQDMGAKVIVLEKNHEIGGSAWYATGFGVHYSKWHKAAGKPDDRDKKYAKFLQQTAGFDVDKELLKRLFEANADWIDWMIDEHRLADLYELNTASAGPMCLSKKVTAEWNDRRIDNMIGPGGGGWLITTSLLKDFTDKGGKVLCSTPAKKLLTNEAGEIIGVVAQDKGGSIEISCKAVVVSSGAFTRSKEIMAKMQPRFYDDQDNRPIHVFTCSTCTGDGITMCEAIGADVDYVNRRVNMFGPMRHPYPGVTLNSGEGPMFRTDGLRFMGSMGMTEVSDLVNVPHRYVWKVVDDGNFESCIQHKIKQGRDTNGVDLTHFLLNWRQVVQEEADAGSLVMADSLAELAEKLGFDPARFEADIAQYNHELTRPQMPPMPGMPAPSDDTPAAPQGFANMMEDFDLSMLEALMGPPAQPLTKGPYYAIKLGMFHENAMGGMVIDKNVNVTRDGVPIHGLYAAGDTTRGVMVPGDVGVVIEGIFSALTYALNSGYIAGEEAAKCAVGK